MGLKFPRRSNGSDGMANSCPSGSETEDCLEFDLHSTLRNVERSLIARIRQSEVMLEGKLLENEQNIQERIKNNLLYVLRCMEADRCEQQVSSELRVHLVGSLMKRMDKVEEGVQDIRVAVAECSAHEHQRPPEAVKRVEELEHFCKTSAEVLARLEQWVEKVSEKGTAGLIPSVFCSGTQSSASEELSSLRRTVLGDSASVPSSQMSGAHSPARSFGPCRSQPLAANCSSYIPGVVVHGAGMTSGPKDGPSGASRPMTSTRSFTRETSESTPDLPLTSLECYVDKVSSQDRTRALSAEVLGNAWFLRTPAVSQLRQSRYQLHRSSNGPPRSVK